MEPRRALFFVFASYASLSLAVTGCDSFPGMSSKSKANSAADAKKNGPAKQANAVAAAPPFVNRPQSPAVFTPGLSVSDAIAQQCGIAPQGAGRAVKPSFEYDSAALGEPDRQMLSEIAKCLTEGALKGRAVTLVGRADTRGEPEYNMTLGESRADAVQRYLIDLGVGKAKTNATSRGELDAVGKDDQGYAEDRRVDIELSP